MIGAQDQRGAQQRRRGRHAPGFRECGVDRGFPCTAVGCNGGERVQDSPAGLRDGARPQVVAERIVRRRERERRLRACDERCVGVAALRGARFCRRGKLRADAGRPAPEQGSDICE